MLSVLPLIPCYSFKEINPTKFGEITVYSFFVEKGSAGVKKGVGQFSSPVLKMLEFILFVLQNFACHHSHAFILTMCKTYSN